MIHILQVSIIFFLINEWPAHQIKIGWVYPFLVILTGPCSFDELFFPYVSGSPAAFGSCHAIKFNGNSRFGETDEICLSNYGKGSRRSSNSQRDVEYGLFKGAVDFLQERSSQSR